MYKNSKYLKESCEERNVSMRQKAKLFPQHSTDVGISVDRTRLSGITQRSPEPAFDPDSQPLTLPGPPLDFT